MASKFKFHKGFSTFDIKTTRNLTRVVKEVLKPRTDFKNGKLIEILIKLRTSHFLRIVDFKYTITDPGQKEHLDGYDTGKEIYTVIFKKIIDGNKNDVKLYWILIRAIKKEAQHNNTIFYEDSSHEEEN